MTVCSADEFVSALARPADADDPRRVIGLVGPPGVGKSTLAARLAVEARAVIAPMDGFHRTNSELDRLGLRDRKGAPETFDADEFVRTVRAVVAAQAPVPWPSFDRTLDEPVPDAWVISPTAPLVVVEGNYLLLDDDPWRSLPPLFDEVAFLMLDPAVRIERLVARHVHHGRSPAESREFVERSDEPNAALIQRWSARATLFVAVD